MIECIPQDAVEKTGPVEREGFKRSRLALQKTLLLKNNNKTLIASGLRRIMGIVMQSFESVFGDEAFVGINLYKHTIITNQIP